MTIVITLKGGNDGKSGNDRDFYRGVHGTNRKATTADIEGLHVAVGGIFLVGVLVGSTAVAMFSDEIKES